MPMMITGGAGQSRPPDRTNLAQGAEVRGELLLAHGRIGVPPVQLVQRVLRLQQRGTKERMVV